MKDRKEDLIEIFKKEFTESTPDQWKHDLYGFEYHKDNISMKIQYFHGHGYSLICKVIVENKISYPHGNMITMHDTLFEHQFDRTLWIDPLGIKKKYKEIKNQMEIKERNKAFNHINVKEIRKLKLKNLDGIKGR